MSSCHPLIESVKLIVECPHCSHSVFVDALNCCIFRHGVIKTNGLQINPHASKELCDFYVEKGMIYGCGKPFQIVQNTDGEYTAVICDYI
jgi:hypothetical protein